MNIALWSMKYAWQFTELRQAPADAVEHGKGTDIEGSLPVLWSLTTLLRPRAMVELGVRQATSTRTLALAAESVGALFLACDPDPGCRRYVKDIPHVQFLQVTGEALLEQTDLQPDLLMIDTDPHTYEQTLGWLQTWVEQRLTPGGVAVFHDIFPARPEIQVSNAVDHWLLDHPAWIWHKLPTDAQGLGLLWRPGV